MLRVRIDRLILSAQMLRIHLCTPNKLYLSKVDMHELKADRNHLLKIEIRATFLRAVVNIRVNYFSLIMENSFENACKQVRSIAAAPELNTKQCMIVCRKPHLNRHHKRRAQHAAT